MALTLSYCLYPDTSFVLAFKQNLIFERVAVTLYVSADRYDQKLLNVQFRHYCTCGSVVAR